MNPNPFPDLRRRFGVCSISLLLFLMLAMLLPEMCSAAQIVQVAASDLEAVERLQRAGLDLVDVTPGGMTEVILMNESDRRDLIATGLPYFVSVADAERYFAGRLPGGRDDMGGYPTFSEIVERFSELHEDFPDVIGEPFSIGESIEGRPLWVIPISDNPDEDEGEPEIYIASAIHCREVITPLVLLNLMETLAEGYGAVDSLTALVEGRKIFLMPVVNPDGYVYNEEESPDGGGMWRKNRRNNGNGTFGVDLNRNWGNHWGYDNIGSSPDSEDETYRGESAFSEPETDAVRDFVNGRNISISIFFHSWSNLCLYPYGYDYFHSPDASVFAALAKKMVAVNRYLPGTGWEVIYRTNGDSDDWMYDSDEHDPIYAYTFEVGGRNDYFWPPLNRVEPLLAENLHNCLTAIDYCDRPARILLPSPPQEVSASSRRGVPTIRWEPVEDEFNPAQFYRIFAQLAGDAVVDGAPADDQRWERVNFNLSQAERRSGTHSYRAALQQPMATMTLKEAIVVPDTIRGWVNYTLRANRGHYAACEGSFDGWSWTPLAGSLTENQVINNVNIGPGITGTSNGWRDCWWATGQFAGRVAKLRFRTYQMNVVPNPAGSEFFYVDDISPFPANQWLRLLADSLEATEWRADDAFDEAVEYFVRAVDAEGDVSFASLPVRSAPVPEPFTLYPPEGWSAISLQVYPEEASPPALFAEWIGNDHLFVMKDGFGRFFFPGWNFNQIARVSPLEGYLIRMTAADSVEIPGEPVRFDEPVPLRRGWNLAGYLPAGELMAEEAFSSLEENLLAAKDYLGRFYVPSAGFNNMAPLRPGQGYWLKLVNPDTLVYPEQGRRIAAERSDARKQEFIPPSPFSMSLLLDVPAGLAEGEIRFYDRDGLLCGTAGLDGEHRIGAAVWGEWERGGTGFADGEALRAFWRNNKGLERPLDLTAGGSDIPYRTNDIVAATLQAPSAALPAIPALKVSPNPFNGRSAATLTLPEASRISLRLYDSGGRFVATLAEGMFDPGVTRIALNLEQLPAGLYLCRLTLPEKEPDDGLSVKMLLVR